MGHGKILRALVDVRARMMIMSEDAAGVDWVLD
jgi:hypothetical protein